MSRYDDAFHHMTKREQSLFTSPVSRRSLLKAASAFSIGTMGLEWIPVVYAQEVAAKADPANQILRVGTSSGVAKTMDFYISVYDRPKFDCSSSLPLVKLNREFKTENVAAESITSNDKGTEWTIKLRDDIAWSNGKPTTADDFVYTFQYSADPKHAWEFTWFWAGNIANYAEAVDGKVGTDKIGVHKGANDYELIIETVEPAPYMPIKLLYSMPLNKEAHTQHGDYYNSNPETQVMNGPWLLEEWLLDQHISMKRNDKYSLDKEAIPVQKLIMKFGKPETWYSMYESNQIDMMDSPAPAELKTMESDEAKKKEVYQGVGDFASYYFFFDVTKAPFDKLEVRQAFSHVVDRDAMKKAIWTSQANQAGSMLMPGFPDANADALAPIQAFDPEKAKELLKTAGFDGGNEFPKLVLNTRGGASPVELATADAYASMLKKHLNIDVEIQNVDRPTFYENMKGNKIQFGFVSYGMDYFDASNMLGVWLSGGRHPWKNSDFDKLVKDATVLIGDDAKRTELFQQAEKLLVEQCPAVFTYFATPIQLNKPYIVGPALEPDSNGIKAIHWPGYGTYSTVPEELWVSPDAPANRT